MQIKSSNALYAMNRCARFTALSESVLKAQAFIRQISNPTRRSEQDLC
jgi:hypothetical protein